MKKRQAFESESEQEEPVNDDGVNPFEEISSEPQYFKQQVELFRVENLSGFIKEGGTKPLKYRDMAICGLGLDPVSWTEKGMPQADANVIRALAGKDPLNGKYGAAYE